ncbi:MAG: hypothetical protein P0Y65_20730 [Candidatus Devosia phytovorans]|uniref:Uncharacterized protein n=1 Tax=Candidatus Devosia phytovorans TaxID=3121372 RepID=A0AAJ6B1L4_9HYPH|nr:hypothetical protein [Devosia sp.]WEK04568.1 MAG: hypothetical protein P0Y65_20730 [Devosia sp.]
MIGTSTVHKVFLGTVQIWANEVVNVLGNRANVLLRSLFTAEQWGDQNLKKRVVVPVGGEIGATVRDFAIAIAEIGTAQADSWGSDLTLEVRGTVSGMGGAPNSGTGGNVIWGNLLGRLGQKLKVILTGLLRSGGGGGGRAGNGGAGQYPYTLTESRSYQNNYNGFFDGSWSSSRESWSSPWSVRWDGATVATSGNSNIGSSPPSVAVGAYTYIRGGHANGSGVSKQYHVSRTSTQQQATQGGIAPDPGRGQGYDGDATLGGAAVGGDTNAGVSGKSGDGGGWGLPGQAGANGTNGNVSAGLAGATAGLAGFYLRDIANMEFTNDNGTALGRVA